jgi:hypothetical protein
MADYPDIYADGFSVTAGRFGVTVTLTRSDPTGEAGSHEDPREVVGRVRLSPQLAKAFADALTKTLATASQGTQPTSKTAAH